VVQPKASVVSGSTMTCSARMDNARGRQERLWLVTRCLMLLSFSIKKPLQFCRLVPGVKGASCCGDLYQVAVVYLVVHSLLGMV
jgi:hypothetical protein